MEENQTQNLNPAPPITPVEQTPPVSNSPQRRGKFKLSLKAVTGTVIFFLLAGGAAASFTVLKPQIIKLVSKPTPTPTPSPTITQSLTPTPDPTVSWKTYTNLDIGFSLKYSPDFSKENCMTFHISGDFLCTAKQGKSVDSLYYVISYSKVEELPKVQGLNINYIEETINNNKVFRTTDLVSAKGADNIFFKSNKGYFINISFSPYNKENKYLANQVKYHSYFDQTLTTFEFTELTLTPSVSQIANLSPQDIGLTAQLDASKNNVVITIKKTEPLKSFDYELDYDSLVDGSYVPRGVIGSTQTIQDNTSFTRQIVLGTCTGGTCKYDKEVKNIYLTLSYTLKDGNKGVMKIAIPSN